MRRFLQILGALFLVVVVLIGGLIGYAAWRGSGLDAQSKAYVDASAKAIAANWDQEQFMSRAAPELLRATSPDQVKAIFARFAEAGPLVRYEGAKGQATMSYFTGTGSSVTAAYVATADCSHAVATMHINLVKHGKWMIAGFHVDFVPLKEPAPHV